ncbi:MAG: replication protein [Nitrosomonadales bacterium]|nr:replication protein [Nitrosomonadales bacterium]
MGIDTVKLKSPPLGEKMVRRIEQNCKRWQQVDYTGEILYQITKGELLGSWDSRISIRPMREDFIINDTGRPVLRACAPYIILECSAAKVFNGHNIYGNPVDFRATCQALIDRIAEILAVPLPKAARWTVRRVDWAENYALPFAAIQEFFEGIYTIQFPRRKASKYGDHAVYFPGSTTTVKIYHKGLEFAKHDNYRMKRFFALWHSQQFPSKARECERWVRRKVAALQRLANNRMRVEVEIHADKLDADFGHQPRVDEVNDEYLKGLHDREIRRLLREGKSGMDTVRLSKAVSERLSAIYGDTLGNLLHGFWCQLSTHGESECKKRYKQRTFYRNRKQLTDAGVSWHCTDVKLIRSVSSVLPIDFTPLRTDPRLCTGRVREKPAFLLDRDFMKLAA